MAVLHLDLEVPVQAQLLLLAPTVTDTNLMLSPMSEELHQALIVFINKT